MWVKCRLANQSAFALKPYRIYICEYCSCCSDLSSAKYDKISVCQVRVRWPEVRLGLEHMKVTTMTYPIAPDVVWMRREGGARVYIQIGEVQHSYAVV